VAVGTDFDVLFHQAVRLWDEGRLDDAERLLAEAAKGGHAGAMARLGRLYCLDPRRCGLGADSAGYWLRRALAARPDDAVAATLLASLLLRWANDEIANRRSAYELWEWFLWPARVDDEYLELWQDEPVERQVVEAHEEAERLLTGVLLASPDDVAASITLADLWFGRWIAHFIITEQTQKSVDARDAVARMGRELAAQGVPVLEHAARLTSGSILSTWCRQLSTALTEATAGRHDQSAVGWFTAADLTETEHSWYLLEHYCLCSNFGDLSLESLLTPDPDELRWACTRWSTLWRCPFDTSKGEALTLLVCDGGVTEIDLTPHLLCTDGGPPRLDWTAIQLPDLRAPASPLATPALPPKFCNPVHYGFNGSL
jgi:hypothetical protein